MEAEVEVEGSDEGKFEESEFGKSSSLLASPKHIADPVVYKLVRVEGDGRLVPATDDEVMEVEGLLVCGKSEMHIIADTGQAAGCISNGGFSSGMPHVESSEGLPAPEDACVEPHTLNSRLEYIEEMLQKVKEEERLRLACGSPDYTSAYVIVDNQSSGQYDKLPGNNEKLQSELLLQENIPSMAQSLSGNHMNLSWSAGECSNPSDSLIEGGSSTSAVAGIPKPDFSKLKGEICLDNLSIRELHETFRATFGRDTTVKDKLWLKRRITMGLTNSCDVSTTTFIIKDSKLVRKGNDEGCNYVDCSLAKDSTIGGKNVNQEVSPVCHGGQSEDHLAISEKRVRNQITDENCGSEYNQNEQRAAKRVRKPTRRYIEELSEAESRDFSGRSMISAKSSGIGLMSPKSHVRPIRNSSDGRTVTTRFDSLGGSGIEVPCVSRVRRSRPRKNFMALLKFDPSSIGMAAKLVEKAFGPRGFQAGNGKENKITNSRYVHEQAQHGFIGVPEKDKQVSAMSTVRLGPDLELKHAVATDLDDTVATVRTSKGGIRRKHHRAWTLSEVMKLVEGVSRYGAGRWSEIKRLAFASYSYRTSVDLKDKWRNLLKASVTQTLQDKGMNSRKNAGSIPIPEPILLRVRELAEIQAQDPQNLSSCKLAANVLTPTTVITTTTASTTSKSVQDKQAGYL